MGIWLKIIDIFNVTFGMFWEILWALILGFLISGIIQAVVSKEKIVQLLGSNSARSTAIASGLGAASSSCSYAATAIARSLFRKGADFTSAIVFQFASTNLVIEMGIILWLLLGWQFTLAEFVGGLLMIILISIFFRWFLSKKQVEKARAQANKGLTGSMEGHAAMGQMSGLTGVSHYFVMDWVSIWRDIAIGLIIAGTLTVLVPHAFWQAFFFEGSGFLSKIWGPIIGPLVAIASFVCSIGNIPLAAVLWNGGISFGGVISFIFADLLILPILNIYRKYYGAKMSVFLLITSYAAMVIAGFIVEMLFSALNILPIERKAFVFLVHISWNYTTILNIVFLAVAALLVWRFLRTGGIKMLKMMDKPEEHNHHCH